MINYSRISSPFIVFVFTVLFIVGAILVRDSILSRSNQTITQINKRRYKRRKIKTLKGEYIIADTFIGKVCP